MLQFPYLPVPVVAVTVGLGKAVSCNHDTAGVLSCLGHFSTGEISVLLFNSVSSSQGMDKEQPHSDGAFIPV